MDIRPLDLVADKNISLKIIKGGNLPQGVPEGTPAWVAPDAKSGGYQIYIYQPNSKKLYNTSWIKGHISYAEFEIGILLHEIAHIKYDSWEGDSLLIKNNGLFTYVDHVIEDARIEYQLSMEHPQYAKYFHWLLASLRDIIDTEAAGKVAKSIISDYTEWLYHLVRFGTIQTGADRDFICFTLPLIVQSPRSGRLPAIAASKAIFYWMDDRLQDELQQVKNEIIKSADSISMDELDNQLFGEGDGDDSAAAEKLTELMSEEGKKGKTKKQRKTQRERKEQREAMDYEADDLLDPNYTDMKHSKESIGKDDIENDIDGEQVASSNERDLIEGYLQDVSDAGGSSDGITLEGSDHGKNRGGVGGGIGQGSDKAVAKVEKDNAFYKQVLQEEGPLLEHFRNIFKRLKNFPSWADAFDGELNLARQQQAYIDSFSGDENENYQVMKDIELSLDLVVMRDISGSTNGMRVEYAKALVVALASLEGFDGIRTGAIDFGDGYSVLKQFGEDIAQANIYPQAQGGTNIFGAINVIKDWLWRSRNKLVIVITDGGIHDINRARPIVKQMEDAGIEFVWIDVSAHDVSLESIDIKADLIRCGVRQLPHVISSTALAKLHMR